MNRNFIWKYVNKRFVTHILFWLFYVLFFGSIYGKYGNDYKWYFIESLGMLPFIMLATYLTIYAILPFYLKKGKLLPTIFLIAFILFAATLGERIALRKINSLPITVDSLFGITFLYLMLETFFMVAIAFGIKLVKKWLEQQQEKHEMEKKNLQTELNFLKTQLHPHFLFNTMNNLYALSLEKSSKTSEGIAKISDLLRSVLYECNESEVALEKEINLIENYIDLEKMRFGNELNVEFQITGNTTDAKIAPMLLFTFVENCFKHGSRNPAENPFIKIEIKVNKSNINFLAENSKLETKAEKQGGIGLQNVKKRLDILYADRHKLSVENKKYTFLVHLVIFGKNE